MKIRHILGTLGAAVLISLSASAPAQAACENRTTDRVGDSDTTQCYPPPCQNIRCR